MSKIHLSASGSFYYVEAPYDISEVKELGARRAKSGWKLPRYRWALLRLVDLFGADNLLISEQIHAEYMNTPQLAPEPEMRKLIPKLWDKLLPHQQQAARFLTGSSTRGSLLNLDPGLGKTFVAIASAQARKANRILVFAPKPFLKGWATEIENWVGESSLILTSKTIKEDFSQAKWVLCNLELVIKHVSKFEGHFDILILDESIKVKNRRTSRVKAVKQLRKKTDLIWLLSGAPISKYADDLWAQFNLIDPKGFSSYWRFAHTYCVVKESQWGSQIIANRRSIDIANEFLDIMFTVKERVLGKKVLANHVRINAPFEPKQSQMFEELKKTFILELSSGTLEAPEVGARLIQLQRITSHPKNIDPAWEIPPGKWQSLKQMLLQEKIKLPTVLWTWWVGTGIYLENELKTLGYSVALVTGATKNQAELIQKFQEGSIQILILSLGVGKYGHTLSSAQSMIYYDITFDMDAYVQSKQRMSGGIRGLAQTKTPTIYTLFTPNSTDVLIHQNLSKKAVSLSHVAQNDLKDLLDGLST